MFIRVCKKWTLTKFVVCKDGISALNIHTYKYIFSLVTIKPIPSPLLFDIKYPIFYIIEILDIDGLHDQMRRFYL